MSCHQLKLIIIFMWELIYFSGIVSEKTCRLNEIFSCKPEESCVQLNSTIGTCKCKREYIRNQDGECVQSPNSNIPDTDDPVLPTPEGVYSHGTSASAITVGLLVPIFLISLLGALVFAAKKYKWLHRVREHAHQLRARHYDTVLVNQEDDPPIA